MPHGSTGVAATLAVLVASLVAHADDARRWVGPGACASRTCHGSTTPRMDRVDSDGRPTLRHDEYTVWATLDPHHRAYDALLGARGVAIARRVGMVDRDADPATWPAHARDPARCLDCHAPVPPAVRGTPAEADWLADGVACEACHGPAGGWLATHTAATRTASLAAGMIDTMKPGRVAQEACLRCHLGTPERRVDHGLLAAGHPPLAFSLDYFARNMPRHWTVHAGNAGWAGARPLVAGDAAATHAAARLMRADAARGGWPDFATFDCAACHHPYGRAPARDGAGDVTGMPPRDHAQQTVLDVIVARAHRPDPSPADMRGALRRLAGRADALAAAGYGTALQTFWAADALVEDAPEPPANILALRAALDRLEADVRFRASYEPARFARDLTALGRLAR